MRQGLSPRFGEKPAWMRPRNRLNPAVGRSHPEPNHSTPHEKILQPSHSKRGKGSIRCSSILLVGLAAVCWFMWHWSQNAIMVILEESKEDLSAPSGATATKPEVGKRKGLPATAANALSSEKNKSKKETKDKPAQNDSVLAAPSKANDAPPKKAKKGNNPDNDKKVTGNQEPLKEDSIEVHLNPGPIFYNVFVPDNKIGNVRIIVKEQIDEWREMVPNSTIIYTLIAKKYADEIEEIFNSTCSRCQLRAKLASGDEADTLQALWEYCQLDTVPSTIANDTLVSYIHTKGSFHPTKINGRGRKRGTRCAFSCRQQMPSNPTLCNMCVSVFRVVPQYHGSTNMWTSTCSYIKGLKSPRVYPELMQAMYDNTLNHTTKQHEDQYRCLRPPVHHQNQLGIGRYAIERWAFSHPEIKPCDLIRLDNRIRPEQFDSGNWTPSPLRKAPRARPRGAGLLYYSSSFSRLEGRLFEWDYIYQKAPPNTSWVWKWYRGHEKGTPEFYERCNNGSFVPKVDTTIEIPTGCILVGSHLSPRSAAAKKWAAADI
eukprot:scaffold8259_cov143-Cylindrotheca_fusiformis.AAC.3